MGASPLCQQPDFCGYSRLQSRQKNEIRDHQSIESNMNTMNLKNLSRLLFLTLIASMPDTGLAQTSVSKSSGIEFVSSLPVTCNPAKGQVVAVVGAPTQYYLCTGTNTWSEYAPSRNASANLSFRNFAPAAINPMPMPTPTPSTGAAPNSTARTSTATVGNTAQADQFIIPYGTRFDRPGLTFPDLRQFGIHQNPGGGWFSINANNIALGAQNGIVGLLRDSQLAWGPSIETPIDCPPCQYGGIGMPAPGVLGITSSNSANALVLGGTWRAAPNSPPEITNQLNNYNPGAPSYFQRWSTDTTRQITGLTFSTPQVSGQVHQIWNVGQQDIVLVQESASSFAANRFRMTSGINITLTPDQCATAIYDGISRRWRVYLCP